MKHNFHCNRVNKLFLKVLTRTGTLESTGLKSSNTGFYTVWDGPRSLKSSFIRHELAFLGWIDFQAVQISSKQSRCLPGSPLCMLGACFSFGARQILQIFQILLCEKALLSANPARILVCSWGTVAQCSQEFRSNDSGIPYPWIIKST